MTAPTPGPWEVSLYENAPPDFVGKRAANGSINAIADLGGSCYRENQEADARLIAAAPDLLSSLIEMVNMFSKSFDHPRATAARGRARKVISNASRQE